VPRCGCQDSCSCLIQAGNGVAVEGIGTVERPYVLSAPSSDIENKIVFEDTSTMDFSTSGSGSLEAPTRVSANATVRVTDLIDVETGTPENGEMMVWQTDHWEFQPPAGVITDHGDLAGLADDDHPQYLDNTRGDVRYYTKALTDATRGVPLDSFTGADDDAKLTAAMTYAAAQTYPPPILLGNRTHTFATARTLYDGFKLFGVQGMSNAEIATTGTIVTRVSTPVGATWLSANGGVRNAAQQWDVTIRNIAFIGTSTTQWLGGTAVMWALNLRDCSWSAYKSILGNQTTKLLLNLSLLDGWLSFNNCYNGAMRIGGSDNNLFMGMTNIDSGTAFNTAGSANGQYHLWLDFMEKTAIGPIYMTAEGGWNGIRVDGAAYNATGSNLGGPLWVNGAKIEGRNAGAPCNGSLVRITGGGINFRDSWFGYAMASPATPGHSPQDAGVIHQSGGWVLVDGCHYDKATSVAETVPFLYTNGGYARISNQFRGGKGGAFTGLPRVSIAADSDATVTEV